MLVLPCLLNAANFTSPLIESLHCSMASSVTLPVNWPGRVGHVCGSLLAWQERPVVRFDRWWTIFLQVGKQLIVLDLQSDDRMT